ncbi:UDP-glucose:glycoprotein glucosyltransferase 2-like [Carlito syrichta]|uniref:UDP-glucose:glycoprotein glucosyltransferase 2-like n=1 Tax=Carlito syrichta TaxID=1868482 RepID=A0A3Q0DMC8_CARSF|nr:UDP-glucose:glycoprotein glucosyltransferase 2-like [Carlito syrichta]
MQALPLRQAVRYSRQYTSSAAFCNDDIPLAVPRLGGGGKLPTSYSFFPCFFAWNEVLSEFMAEESNEKFWQFLETVQELAIYKQTESDYSYYNLILKKAGQFLDNLHINLLKFAFSIRAYSPTIEMFQQIAADEPPPDGCKAFVVIHKKHTCKINEIKKLLKKAPSRPRPYLFKGDHKFPTNKENLPVIILYAEMGTRSFSAFHKVLSEKAQNGEILYVLRHYIQENAKRLDLSLEAADPIVGSLLFTQSSAIDFPEASLWSGQLLWLLLPPLPLRPTAIPRRTTIA